MTNSRLSLWGVLVSLALFVLAASFYPGGYDWEHDFISALFAPSTATGAANKTRYLTVFAMVVFCLSVAVLFRVLSSRTSSRVHKKTLGSGGFGSMVYAFLVVTSMHDLLVGIALLFFVPAMLAALHLMSAEGRPALGWAGSMCLALLLASAVMYYGSVLWHLLPLAQKVSLVACVSWLLTMRVVTEKRTDDARSFA